jgi:hypothetical protein
MTAASTHPPEVTVLMAVYNGARFLDDAIKSIRAQTYGNYEFLIIDDGSTDASTQILARQAAADTRIRILTQENRGLIASLNRGFQESAGEFIARMDADDVARPQRLAAQVEFLNGHPDIALVGGAVEIIDTHGRPSQIVRLPETPERLRWHMRNLGCALAHPTVMFRRQAVLDAGGFRPGYQHAEDYDLWLRMLDRHDFANLSEVLLSYRRHEGSISNRHTTQQILSAFCARVAAGRRVRGLDDPTSSVDLITPEVVCSLGVDPQELNAEMFRGLSEATEMAVDQGRPSAAAEFLTVARPYADPAVLHETALKHNRRALNAPASEEERSQHRRALLEASPEIYRELFGAAVRAAAQDAPERVKGDRPVSSNVLSNILKQNRYDTDKCEEPLRQYDRCFAHLRTRSISVLEVGVNRGGSLYLWRDYFERATIVGLDLSPPPDFVDPSGRCRLFQCDQGDPSALRRIAKANAPNGFHIIIDDASHLAALTAVTFKTLFFDHLQPGGFYAIEDWGTGYWGSWPDGEQISPPVELSLPFSGNHFPSHEMGMVGLLKQLIDECALSDIFHHRFGMPRTRTSWIRSMHVCAGLVIIEKAWE